MIEDSQEIKDFEEITKKIDDRKDKLELTILIAILRALNKLIQKY